MTSRCLYFPPVEIRNRVRGVEFLNSPLLDLLPAGLPIPNFSGEEHTGQDGINLPFMSPLPVFASNEVLTQQCLIFLV